MERDSENGWRVTNAEPRKAGFMALEQALILKFGLAYLEGLHQAGHITLLSDCIREEMDPHPAVLYRLDNSQAIDNGILVLSLDQVGRTLELLTVLVDEFVSPPDNLKYSRPSVLFSVKFSYYM